MADLEPIRRRCLSDAVYEQLRDQIVRGGFETGDQLPAERVLCEKLGVNRGALREALKRLEQARLIDVAHGGGSTVLDYRRHAGMDLLGALLLTERGQVNTKVARSVVEMRAVLGPDIARLAAQRGDAPAADRLDQLTGAMANATADLAVLQQLSMEFWETLVDASDNVAYRLAYNALHASYGAFRSVTLGVMADELADLRRFCAIARAVRHREESTAERSARALLSRGADAVLELLQALEAAQTPEPDSPIPTPQDRP